MAKKKILCYIADFRGCGYYRIFLPYVELHRRGLYDVKISSLTDGNDIMKADIVVFQRQHHDPTMSAILAAKKFKKIVISESDDLLEAMPYYNPGENAEIEVDKKTGQAKVLKSQFSKDSPNIQTLNRVFATSHAVTVTTRNLAGYHERVNGNIFVLQNFIDGQFIRATTPQPHPAFIYAAGAFHQGDMDILMKPFRRLMQEKSDLVFYNVGTDYRAYLMGKLGLERTVLDKPPMDNTFPYLTKCFLQNHRFEELGDPALNFSETAKEFIGNKMKEYRICWEWDGWETGQEKVLGQLLRDGSVVSYPIEPIHWEVRHYYDAIYKTGAWFGVAPLCQTEFNSAKSWLKMLEYAMHGIPAIASNFGQYSELVSGMDPYRAKRTANAFCMGANDYSDWIKAMKILAEEKEVQARMSRAALEFSKLMTIQNNVHLWDNMIQSFYEKELAA
jgi:glycosyltransferase involved in cell wall biosynthesis